MCHHRLGSIWTIYGKETFRNICIQEVVKASPHVFGVGGWVSDGCLVDHHRCLSIRSILTCLPVIKIIAVSCPNIQTLIQIQFWCLVSARQFGGEGTCLLNNQLNDTECLCPYIDYTVSEWDLLVLCLFCLLSCFSLPSFLSISLWNALLKQVKKRKWETCFCACLADR